jgi:catechol 2,3-dioxygenase-like lactoylglutathione lyase family enzyme
MQIARIDHLNLTVSDIDRTCEFYQRVLGLERVSWGKGRAALKFGEQKINLDPLDMEKPEGGRRQPAHLCFVSEAPLGEVIAHLDRVGVPIAMGPGPRNGATGTIESVYINDPDGNSIEIATY